jgi:hypothetical protein
MRTVNWTLVSTLLPGVLDGTYNTSDDFPAQKIRYPNSVALHYIPDPEGYSLE